MDNEILIRKLIAKDLARCEALLERFETELPKLPAGSLAKRKNGSLSVSVRDGRKQYQIALSEEDELEKQLRKKRYIKEALPKLRKQITASNLYLKNSTIYDPVRLMNALPKQYHDLKGLDIFLAGDVNPEEWLYGEWEQNNFHSDKLIHRTPAGIEMRSKSEVLIGSQLERLNIPYHYEPIIEIEGKLYAPDFEMLHPVLRRLIYLEHFGMVDDPVYMAKNLEKLKDYSKAGIVLGHNLFFTYETKQNPLTISAINKVIDEILSMEP